MEHAPAPAPPRRALPAQPGRAPSAPGPVPEPTAEDRAHGAPAAPRTPLRRHLGTRPGPGRACAPRSSRASWRPARSTPRPRLAERFGVSATPVREAMQQLAVEGAVEVRAEPGLPGHRARTPANSPSSPRCGRCIEVPVMLRLARSVPADRWAALRPLAEATVAAADDRRPGRLRRVRPRLPPRRPRPRRQPAARHGRRRPAPPRPVAPGHRPALAPPHRPGGRRRPSTSRSSKPSRAATCAAVQTLVREHFAGAR